MTYSLYLTPFRRLACRCAERSKQDGFTYFGLQDYGRCFSGPHAASSYNNHGSSNRCSNQHYQSCDDDAWGECVGKAKEVNYVYQIVEGTKDINIVHLTPFDSQVHLGYSLHSIIRSYIQTEVCKSNSAFQKFCQKCLRFNCGWALWNYYNHYLY